MMYPITANALYIQTDNIIDMTFSTLTVKMSNGDTHVVSAAQFADILNVINTEANH
jgi:hypothetical protein